MNADAPASNSFNSDTDYSPSVAFNVPGIVLNKGIRG